MFAAASLATLAVAVHRMAEGGQEDPFPAGDAAAGVALRWDSSSSRIFLQCRGCYRVVSL